ncbi:MAG: MaoC/PaaZ C-terminal domain-containing protein [Trebonia sp.]
MTATQDRDGWPRDEQRGLWYEDLQVGVVYVHQPGRTMTEYDNILFSSLSMNPQALHIDFAFAESLEPFGKPLVNSMYTRCCASLSCARTPRLTQRSVR